MRCRVVLPFAHAMLLDPQRSYGMRTLQVRRIRGAIVELWIILGAAFFWSPAQSATTQFHYSYSWASGNSISGLLEGELQADNDRVFVTAIHSSAYSVDASMEFPSGPANNPAAPSAIASISGQVMSVGTPTDGDFAWVISRPSCCGSGIMAALVKDPGPDGVVVEHEDFSAARWSLTAVPVPAAAWLFGPAMSLLAPWVRRRARA